MLKGRLTEHHLDGRIEVHTASLLPFVTRRSTYHKVSSTGRSWVLTLRGPWARTWKEHVEGKHLVLTWGRKILFVFENKESHR